MSSARNVTDIPGRAHVSEELSRRFGFRSLFIITVAIAPAAAAATVSPPSKSFVPFFIAYEERYDSNARSQNAKARQPPCASDCAPSFPIKILELLTERIEPDINRGQPAQRSFGIHLLKMAPLGR